MTLATQYAVALRSSSLAPRERLEGLKNTLKRRGHIKLLPRIFAEYQKLEEEQERLARYKTTTPAQEQTRTLLELYQTLVQSNG